MLAVIPVAAGYAIRAVYKSKTTAALRYGVLAVLAVLWFVFLPNTCYLLTEWRHFLVTVDGKNLFLRARVDNAYLIELISLSLFYFLYSSFGMLMFALAIRPVEKAVVKGGLALRLWAFPFFAAVSVGVYLGLILRFNSWDLLTRPATVWSAVIELTARPVLSMFIIGFGVFLWIAYELLDIWIDGFHYRLALLKNTNQEN
jgi:uncharacterized membrane protein